ncbi:peptidase c80 family domain-containing protein [Ditylenchus destructor]|nr:peptidase c80 family domain-containing protein [Ditylenchus destructor]
MDVASEVRVRPLDAFEGPGDLNARSLGPPGRGDPHCRGADRALARRAGRGIPSGAAGLEALPRRMAIDEAGFHVNGALVAVPRDGLSAEQGRTVATGWRVKDDAAASLLRSLSAAEQRGDWSIKHLPKLWRRLGQRHGAWLLARKHEGHAVWLQDRPQAEGSQLFAVSGNRFLEGLTGAAEADLLVVGHGGMSTAGEQTLSGWTPQRLASRLQEHVQRLPGPPGGALSLRRVSLISCDLASPYVEAPFAKAFAATLLHQPGMSRVSVTARTGRLHVISTDARDDERVMLVTERNQPDGEIKLQHRMPGDTVLYARDGETGAFTITDKYPAGDADVPGRWSVFADLLPRSRDAVLSDPGAGPSSAPASKGLSVPQPEPGFEGLALPQRLAAVAASLQTRVAPWDLSAPPDLQVQRDALTDAIWRAFERRKPLSGKSRAVAEHMVEGLLTGSTSSFLKAYVGVLNADGANVAGDPAKLQEVHAAYETLRSTAMEQLGTANADLRVHTNSAIAHLFGRAARATDGSPLLLDFVAIDEDLFLNTLSPPEIANAGVELELARTLSQLHDTGFIGPVQWRSSHRPVSGTWTVSGKDFVSSMDAPALLWTKVDFDPSNGLLWEDRPVRSFDLPPIADDLPLPGLAALEPRIRQSLDPRTGTMRLSWEDLEGSMGVVRLRVVDLPPAVDGGGRPRARALEDALRRLDLMVIALASNETGEIVPGRLPATLTLTGDALRSGDLVVANRSPQGWSFKRGDAWTPPPRLAGGEPTLSMTGAGRARAIMSRPVAVAGGVVRQVCPVGRLPARTDRSGAAPRGGRDLDDGHPQTVAADDGARKPAFAGRRLSGRYRGRRAARHASRAGPAPPGRGRRATSDGRHRPARDDGKCPRSPARQFLFQRPRVRATTPFRLDYDRLRRGIEGPNASPEDTSYAALILSMRDELDLLSSTGVIGEVEYTRKRRPRLRFNDLREGWGKLADELSVDVRSRELKEWLNETSRELKAMLSRPRAAMAEGMSSEAWQRRVDEVSKLTQTPPDDPEVKALWDKVVARIGESAKLASSSAYQAAFGEGGRNLLHGKSPLPFLGRARPDLKQRFDATSGALTIEKEGQTLTWKVPKAANTPETDRSWRQAQSLRELDVLLVASLDGTDSQSLPNKLLYESGELSADGVEIARIVPHGRGKHQQRHQASPGRAGQPRPRETRSPPGIVGSRRRRIGHRVGGDDGDTSPTIPNSRAINSLIVAWLDKQSSGTGSRARWTRQPRTILNNAVFAVAQERGATDHAAFKELRSLVENKFIKSTPVLLLAIDEQFDANATIGQSRSRGEALSLLSAALHAIQRSDEPAIAGELMMKLIFTTLDASRQGKGLRIDADALLRLQQRGPEGRLVASKIVKLQPVLEALSARGVIGEIKVVAKEETTRRRGDWVALGEDGNHVARTPLSEILQEAGEIDPPTLVHDGKDALPGLSLTWDREFDRHAGTKALARLDQGAKGAAKQFVFTAIRAKGDNETEHFLRFDDTRDASTAAMDLDVAVAHLIADGYGTVRMPKSLMATRQAISLVRRFKNAAPETTATPFEREGERMKPKVEVIERFRAFMDAGDRQIEIHRPDLNKWRNELLPRHQGNIAWSDLQSRVFSPPPDRGPRSDRRTIVLQMDDSPSTYEASLRMMDKEMRKGRALWIQVDHSGNSRTHAESPASFGTDDVPIKLVIVGQGANKGWATTLSGYLGKDLGTRVTAVLGQRLSTQVEPPIDRVTLLACKIDSDFAASLFEDEFTAGLKMSRSTPVRELVITAYKDIVLFPNDDPSRPEFSQRWTIGEGEARAIHHAKNTTFITIKHHRPSKSFSQRRELKSKYQLAPTTAPLSEDATQLALDTALDTNLDVAGSDADRINASIEKDLLFYRPDLGDELPSLTLRSLFADDQGVVDKERLDRIAGDDTEQAQLARDIESDLAGIKPEDVDATPLRGLIDESFAGLTLKLAGREVPAQWLASLGASVDGQPLTLDTLKATSGTDLGDRLSIDAQHFEQVLPLLPQSEHSARRLAALVPWLRRRTGNGAANSPFHGETSAAATDLAVRLTAVDVDGPASPTRSESLFAAVARPAATTEVPVPTETHDALSPVRTDEERRYQAVAKDLKDPLDLNRLSRLPAGDALRELHAAGLLEVDANGQTRLQEDRLAEVISDDAGVMRAATALAKLPQASFDALYARASKNMQARLDLVRQLRAQTADRNARGGFTGVAGHAFGLGPPCWASTRSRSNCNIRNTRIRRRSG